MTQKSSSSVTIHDIARQASVSVATVSRYINRKAPVSTEVATRLDAVMSELKYVPYIAAQQLATGKTNMLGLSLTNMHNDFFGPLLGGIEEIVREQEYHLVIATSRADSRYNSFLPIGPHNTDGMLVFADSLSDRDLIRFHSNNFPMVLIHRTAPPHLQIPSVTVENKSATRKIIDHLIENHQKRQILFLRGPSNQEDTRWRETGYKLSLEAHGIPFESARVIHGGFERDIAYYAMKGFLADKDHIPFDAVFTGDDDAAIGAVLALQEAGLNIPNDIAVAGFDDSKLSALMSPPLTTVRAPTREVGRTAAEILFKLFRGEIVEPVKLLPTEIILRRSCGCTHDGNPY